MPRQSSEKMAANSGIEVSSGLDRPDARDPDPDLARNTTAGIEAGADVDADLMPYPEGGLDAWLVVLGAWCAMIPSMGLLNTLAILQAWVSENQLAGLPESTVGWIFSTYGFFLYFTGAQTGPIFDAYPVRLLVIPGSIGIVASIFFLSVSKEFYQYLLSFGVLGGISASLLFNPSISAVGHWFFKRRALATGVACTAGGIGGVVFPLIILYAAPHIGFAWALRIVGFVCAAAGILASCLLRKRLPPNKKAGASVDLKSLAEPRFAATALATFLVEFAVFIPYTYICSYAIHAGLDRSTAYLLNALLNAGAVPGRALPGYIADRFGTFNVMCATALACVATILALWSTAGGNRPAQVVSFAPLFGFWSGAAISLTPVCIGQVCRTEDYGKRSGTAFFVASFGVLVGIPIAGAILERDGGEYLGLIVFAGTLYAAALVAFVVARGLSVGWRVAVIF
ncbi:major facilitator superfamily domain-containing protein [Nemania sp. FL0916]|nr:major facilitator superfamily domain-containing protein [Nemania sp. FL0916]